MKENLDAMILECCRQPMTLDELAEETGANYYTVRYRVSKLEKDNQLIQLPYRRGKRSVYQITVGRKQGELNVFWEGRGWLSVGDFVSMLTTSSSLPRSLNLIAGVFGFLARKSYMDDRGKPASTLNRIEAFRALKYLRDEHKKMLSIIEQLLMAEIWSDDVKDLDTLLHVSIDDTLIAQLGVDFEHWWMEKKDSVK